MLKIIKKKYKKNKAKSGGTTGQLAAEFT